ncbi:MAG: YafY family transcriptional regulator [Hyphomicrobiales bacterium]|nr:YafY family transcriptional regulator [Hyphomicrobiales bacterium]
MRKASRLFEIIQVLRSAKAPITAAQISERLEVGVRSVYRDIAALQAMRVPIEGERGIGYVLRRGFDLPPLMFTHEEAEAIVLGMALVERTGDRKLARAAVGVLAKVSGAVSAPVRRTMASGALLAWGRSAPSPVDFDFEVVRRAIRDEEKLHIEYRDAQDRISTRIVRPLALAYYADVVVLVAWCELRQAIRDFRVDRVIGCVATGAHFTDEGDRLRSMWAAGFAADRARSS